MSKTINVSKIINARLDALPTSGTVTDQEVVVSVSFLKDYFSDIDEEIAKLRKPKPKEHENYCWYCGESRMYPVVDYSPWYECYGCGATKCLNPTEVHAISKIRWGSS